MDAFLYRMARFGLNCLFYVALSVGLLAANSIASPKDGTQETYNLNFDANKFDIFMRNNYSMLTSSTLNDYSMLDLVEKLIRDYPTADATYIIYEQLFRDILVDPGVRDAMQNGSPANYFIAQLKTANHLEELYDSSGSSNTRIARKLMLIRKYMAIRFSYATMPAPGMLDVKYIDGRISDLLSEESAKEVFTADNDLYEPLFWHMLARKHFLASFIADRETHETSAAVSHFIRYHRILQDHQNAFAGNPFSSWFHLEEFFGIQQASPNLLRKISVEQDREYTKYDTENWHDRRLMQYRKIAFGREAVVRLKENVCDGVLPEPAYGGVYGVRFAGSANVAAFTREWDTTESLRLRQQMLSEYPKMNDILLAFQYYRIGELYGELDRFDKAVEANRMCLNLNPPKQLEQLAQIAITYYRNIISGKIPKSKITDGANNTSESLPLRKKSDTIRFRTMPDSLPGK